MSSYSRVVAAILGAAVLGLLWTPGAAADTAESARLRAFLGVKDLEEEGAIALQEHVLQQLAAAEAEHAPWGTISLEGLEGRPGGRGEQKISPRRLSGMMPAIRADLAQMLVRVRLGQTCVSSMGLPSPLESNITDVMEPVKIAIRQWRWHRASAWFLKIWLHEFYRVPITMVELETDGRAVEDELRAGTIDLDFESWVSSEKVEQLGRDLGSFGALGYSCWPGIFATPSLVAGLRAATPNMTTSSQQTWFTSYRALASQELLDLLPAASSSECSTSRCFIPPQCQGRSLAGCRVLYHESPMPLGEEHAKNLVVTHALPLMIVYKESSEAETIVSLWNSLPPMLVVASNRPKPSSLTNLHRFLFPYSTTGLFSFDGTAQDYKITPVYKLARRDLEMRMPELIRWFLNDFYRDEISMSYAEFYESLAPSNATADEQAYLAACYLSRSTLQFVSSMCFDANRKFICVRKSSIKCRAGEYPLQRPDRWYCHACPEGSYCPPNTEMPVPCPNGTTAKPGASEVAACQCMPGLGIAQSSETAAASCSPCSPGLFKMTMGNLQCNGRCPQHSSSREGSTSIIQCECDAGFYLQSVMPWRCVRCPTGATCPGGLEFNVTDYPTEDPSAVLVDAWRNHSLPFSRPDFYAYSLQTPTNATAVYLPLLLPCPEKGTCLGRNLCSESTTGSGCRVCRPSFRRSLDSIICRECADAMGMVPRLLLRLVIEPLVQLLLLRMIAVASKDTAVLTPIFIKISGLFFLAARTCIVATVPQGALRPAGRDVIGSVATALMEVIDVIAGIFEVDFSFMPMLHCWLGQHDADLSESELPERMILFYRLRMIEVLLMPLLWPIGALAFILPLGCCMHRGNSRTLQAKLSSLKRMQLLAAREEDSTLHVSQQMIQETVHKLVVQNSWAGLWRPFTYEVKAQAEAEDRLGELPTGCYLYFHSFLRNMVSMFMPFWFFHYLNLVANCMKAVFSCNRVHDQATDSVFWWHGFEPALGCFSEDHMRIATLGVIGLIVYGLGIPLLVCWVVRRKMKHSEEWCFGFNVNGYTFWGSLTVYWDAVLLMRSAALSFVGALPSETFQNQKELLAILICAVGMVLQSAVQPFDARRSNLMNKLEARSLASATLICPLLIAAVQFEQQNYDLAVKGCLLLFIALVTRFIFRISVEITREVRDAMIHFHKQAAFASMVQQKREQREVLRKRQQKQWLDNMLSKPKPKGDSASRPRRTTLAAGGVEQPTGQPEASDQQPWSPSGMFARVRGHCAALMSLEGDEDENDWSDFSEDIPMGPQTRPGRCSCSVFLKMLIAFVEGTVKWLGWNILLTALDMSKWMVHRMYLMTRKFEEMQNRFGLVIDTAEQTFTFQGNSSFSSPWQREEVVMCFSAYLHCLLEQHCVPRFPCSLPKSFLMDALHLKSSNPRSLKWKALRRKVDRLLQGVCHSHSISKLDDDLITAAHALESKLKIWLSLDKVSRQLIRVQSIETYILHVQFMEHERLVQSLTLAAINDAKPQEVDRAVDRDCVVQLEGTRARSRNGSLHSLERQNDMAEELSLAPPSSPSYSTGLSLVSAARLDEDMVLSEKLPAHPSPSHLAEYWRMAHGLLRDDFQSEMYRFSFWDPLQDPRHERLKTMASGESDPKAPFFVQTLPITQRDSTLTSGLKSCDDSDLENLEPAPWPVHEHCKLTQLIAESPFLDLRTKHACLRLHVPLANLLLRDLGKQHDILRSCLEGVAERVVEVTKEVAHCRAQGQKIRGSGTSASKVLDKAEDLVIAIGLRNGLKIFSELSKRLGGSDSERSSWQRSHALWFEKIARERMREFTARWTPWGVPVISPEEASVMNKFELNGSQEIQVDIPPMHEVHAWTLCKQLLRRNANIHKLQTGCSKGSADDVEEQLTQVPEDPVAAIAETPAGTMLAKEDWESLARHLESKYGQAFAKQFWMVLEERRQIMLDWVCSVATRLLTVQPMKASATGTPFCLQLELHESPAAPPVRRVEQEVESSSVERRVALDRCRRAFGLGCKNESRSEGEEVSWCVRGLHDLQPLQDLRVPRLCSCDICEAIMGKERNGKIFICVLCNNVFCEGCAHLAAFLTSDFEEHNLKPGEQVGACSAEAHVVMDNLESTDPWRMMNELNKLDGMLSCQISLDGVAVDGREMVAWAQERVLSGVSVLSMLLCKEGRHELGFLAIQPKAEMQCAMCPMIVTKKFITCGVCCNCDAFYCDRCTSLVQNAEYLRSEITRLWSEGLLDDSTREKLCMHLKKKPLGVLSVLYRVMEAAHASQQAHGSVRDFSVLVHRTLNAEDVFDKTLRPMETMSSDVVDREAFMQHKRVGPDGKEMHLQCKTQAVQASLALVDGAAHMQDATLHSRTSRMSLAAGAWLGQG